MLTERLKLRVCPAMLLIRTATLLVALSLSGHALCQTWNIGSATLSVTPSGIPAELKFSPEPSSDASNSDQSSASIAANSGPLCFLETQNKTIAPTLVSWEHQNLTASFTDGSTLRFSATPHPGFTLFKLQSLDLKSSVTKIRLFQLPVPEGAALVETLNGYTHQGNAVALMAAQPDVLPVTARSGARSVDRAGCSHSFTQTSVTQQGRGAARFTATCDSRPGGWSMQGMPLATPIADKHFAGLSAWIHGDGGGQQLKFQLDDGAGGARDYYVSIDFTGWRHIEMTQPALDTIHGDNISGLNLYYNSLPAGRTVECLVDDVRALVVHPGETTSSVSLEDFETVEAPWWLSSSRVIGLEVEQKFGFDNASFGIIACPESQFMDTIKKFEKAGDIPAPYPDGVWNKQSPAVHENYLFLTSFSEPQFDAAVALARRGGFKRVLLGQESWCRSTGHYQVNTNNFPGGLPALVNTVKRFRAAGIDVGLHVLSASIDSSDSYITPVPDPRLVKDAETTLVLPLDATETSITVAEMPEGFPAEDGGYTGHGTVLQVGDELIRYGARSTTAPYTFTSCQRGYLGTRPAGHPASVPVHHLARSYGYHLYDMDTTLLDEVASNFAAVANACDIGMIYFDGSEGLQGDHRRYNARLISSFLSKLNRKDILLQASSYSHYSWHLLARAASADGHGDLKGYLEQRAPGFADMKRNGMPTDIGWYYGYDTSATPDMYEYILGTTIGYDASFSYQVSVAAAAKHPFTNDILDLVARYEKIRKTGIVPDYMRELLRVPKPLLGRPPEDETRPTELRRDYKLIGAQGKLAFQRVIYEPWKTSENPANILEWKTTVTTGPALVGFQIQALPAAGQAASPGETSQPLLLEPWFELDGRRIPVEAELAANQYLFQWPGEKPSLSRLPGLEVSTPGDISTTPTTVALPEGVHTVRFGAGDKSRLPFRVRLTLQPPERHEIRDETLRPPGADLTSATLN